MKSQNPLTDALRTLVEDNLSLISFAMKKLPVYLFDSPDDAFQIGTIGLMKAARAFDPGRGYLFPAFAVSCIVNELRMALRHISTSNPPGRICSYDAVLTNSDGESFSLIELIPSNDQLPEEQYVVKEKLRAVILALKRMKDSDSYMILQMVVQNRRQEEIAAFLGVTQSAVSRKIRKIRSTLRSIVL